MKRFDAQDALERAGLSCNFNGDTAAEMMKERHSAIPDDLLPHLAAWMEAAYWIGHSDGASAAMTD